MSSGNKRVLIQKKGNTLVIRIPVRKNIKAMAAVIMAAVPWVLMLWWLVARSQLHHTISWAPKAYLLAIIIWFGVGIAGYTFLSWMFFGRERIMLADQQMLIEKPLVFYNRRSYYQTQFMTNLRIGKEIYKARENGVWVDRERTILLFDYPGKQVTFGRGTNAEEAEMVLLALARHGSLAPKTFAATHLI